MPRRQCVALWPESGRQIDIEYEDADGARETYQTGTECVHVQPEDLAEGGDA